IEKFGAVGLIVGSTSGWILSQVIMNFYYHKVLKLEISRFFAELFHQIGLTFILALALGFALNFLPGSGWLNLVLKISVFVLIFSVLMFKFGMNQSEKAAIKSVLPKFLK
uniref:hypothetical protein n=1 Tax=Flavobacterium sp. TaxID=239 RepID=UPI0037BF62DD